MTKQFLKKVISLTAGKQAEEIIDFLYRKDYVNEFLISKRLGITINQTRNILYKIFNNGFVSFVRKKDKKKGWYTYFWKIEILKCLEFLREILQERIERTQNQIKNRETKNFYLCNRCNIEHNEENALLYNFICIECGDILEIRDNKKVIKSLKKRMEELKEEMELIEGEVKEERDKINKKIMREIKKEEQEKAAKRSRKKAEKKKTAAKKTTKKIVKKVAGRLLKKKTSKKRKSKKK